MIARVLNLLLGLAIAGTSVWDPPGTPVYWHDLGIGLAIAAISLVAMAVRGANYLATVLGLWFFFSGINFPIVPHIYVGIVGGTLVFIFSLVPTSDRTFWPFGASAPASS
jgi:hypothetical protein